MGLQVDGVWNASKPQEKIISLDPAEEGTQLTTLTDVQVEELRTRLVAAMVAALGQSVAGSEA
jgi:hypothetical protein